ncbi:MAG: glycerol-3-phosphate acyltransferase, partial [Cyanobacteria bacterium J06638_22]
MAWVVGSLILVAAYLLGSIPTGYIVARMAKGIDIREH